MLMSSETLGLIFSQLLAKFSNDRLGKKRGEEESTKERKERKEHFW